MEHYLILAAVVVDRLVGDPRSAYHPVVLIGNLIFFLEKKLLESAHTPARKKVSGALLVVIVLAATYTLSYFIIKALGFIHPWAAFAGGAVLLSFAISPRSLSEAGQEIKNCLLQGALEQGRQKVGYIVGRDTANLNTPEITRATVETVAENIVDGIISPLFYAVIGGAPLAFLYRAVNTMDSMVGYKNNKYKDFGLVAARVDDVFNYIPARITAFLIVLASFILRYDFSGSIKAIWRDAGKHPSPNSGLAEAGVAGALGVRLGGLNFYGGVSSFRAYMGENKNELAPEHIKKTIYIMYLVTALFVGLIFLIKWVK